MRSPRGGHRADELTRDHLAGSTFGNRSPFCKMRTCDGVVIAVGVPPTTFTLFHVVEELHPKTYEHNYDDTLIPMTVIDGEEKISYEVDTLRPDRDRDYWPAIRLLRRHGILRFEKCHGLTVSSARVDELIDHTLKIIDEGRFGLR